MLPGGSQCHAEQARTQSKTTFSTDEESLRRPSHEPTDNDPYSKLPFRKLPSVRRSRGRRLPMFGSEKGDTWITVTENDRSKENRVLDLGAKLTESPFFLIDERTRMDSVACPRSTPTTSDSGSTTRFSPKRFEWYARLETVK